MMIQALLEISYQGKGRLKTVLHMKIHVFKMFRRPFSTPLRFWSATVIGQTDASDEGWR